MKIHSSFKDYYDRAQEQTDNRIRYIRETIEIEEAKAPMPFREVVRYVPRLDGFDRGIIGFCGELFPFYSHVRQEKAGPLGEWIRSDPYIIDYFYAYEAISAADRKYHKKLREKRRLSLWPFDRIYFDSRTWMECLAAAQRKTGPDLFREIKAPVFLVQNPHGVVKLTVNPRLNLLQFQKVINPYQAFQELEMFIGTDLAEQKDPEVHISDELRAESHGFDKYSFRKMGKHGK